jgi:hypothetical protein
VADTRKDGGAERDRDKIPRGAIAVVVVGLVATLAAALLANENLSGDAVGLEWVQVKSIPDSAKEAIPGGGAMRLTDIKIHATGVNVSDYSLFSSAAVLRIDAGSRVGSARIECTIKGHGRETEIGQTEGSRASYPRSSEVNLAEQPMPETGVQVEFASHGTGLAEVLLEDLPEQAANVPGIKLEWPSFHTSVEHWRWFLPSGTPAKELVLPFVTVWRTTSIPSFDAGCTITTSAGEASVRTSGKLAKLSEPIAE